MRKVPIVADDLAPTVTPPVTTGGHEPAKRAKRLEPVVAVEQWDSSGQVVIKTTEAALRNVLHRHLEASGARDGWVPPLTVVLPIVLALATGVRSQTTEEILLGALGAALLWLLARLRIAFRHRGRCGVEAVIDDLHPRGPRRR